MQNQINRRDLLKSSALAAAGLALSPLLTKSLLAEPAGGARKKVLFFTKSQTFQHSVVARPSPGKLSYAEQIVTDLGAKHGYDVVCSKDGSIFTPENIAGYDGFIFFTTGDLTQPSNHDSKTGRSPLPSDGSAPNEPGMPAGGKEAFLDAIKGGKGFVGFHAASDTFHSKDHHTGKYEPQRTVDAEGHDDFDPYIQMIGGEFILHGKQQPATLRCVDPKFPGAKAFDGERFAEEWYSLKNFAPDLHVILVQDCKGMRGPMYQRGPFPETWARMHGKGRVFYTSMGHREDVWQRPEYTNLVLNALNWTTGRIDVDVTPNIKEVAPEAEVQKAGT